MHSFSLRSPSSPDCSFGVVYGVTKEPIANAKANSKQEAFQSVLSDADSFETVDDLDTDAASELLKSNGYSSDAIEEVALGKR